MNKIDGPLPGLPAGTPKIIRPDRCENCKYAEREASPSTNYTCHYNPPTATVIPSNKGPAVVSAFAVVQPDQWCYRHKKKVLGGGG